MPRSILLLGVLALALQLFTFKVFAGTPGMYYADYSGYTTSEVGSAYQAAVDWEILRCVGNRKPKGSPVLTYTSNTIHDPGTTNIHSEYGAVCNSSSSGFPVYQPIISIYYTQPVSCPVGEEFNPSSGECQLTCDSPNYIDVVSGECVPPAEICYTDLESMADKCVLLREDDPLGENCVTDASGLELCLDDNPLCYQANGKTFCPDPDSVCGEKNGSFQCVSPQEEGCGMFNGEKVCFDPSGDKVDSDSPDHPDNGGNLDGDNTNDETDPRDPADGGDPDNQPGDQPIDVPESGRASEETARESLGTLKKSLAEQKKISASLKDIQDNGLKTDLSGEISESEKNAIIQNGASGSWDDPATGTWAGVEDHITGIGEADGNALGDGLADGIGSTAMGLVDQGSCSDLGYQVEGFAFSLGCDKTQKIRDFLSWGLYLLTVWALFEIVVTPATRKS